MPAKVYEEPKGSDNWCVSIAHQGFEWSRNLGTDKQLALEIEARVKAAASRGSDDLGVQEAMIFALLDYDELPEYERRRQTFRLIPGGRTD